MTDDVLLSARDGRVLVLTLNRPDRLNALSPDLHHALQAAVRAAADDPDIGCVVLTGAGRGFCSGGDVGPRPAADAKPISQEQRIDTMVHNGDTVKLLHTMGKPTLALINGAAAGAGLVLALACDLRIAANDAVLTTSYARVALSGDHGASYFLTRLLGPARAAELLFLSDKVDAAAALAMGLVNRVAAADQLQADGLAMAHRLAAGPPVALRYMKRNIRHAETASLDEVISREAEAMVRCSKTEDVKEALLARREKREPVFKGF